VHNVITELINRTTESQQENLRWQISLENTQNNRIIETKLKGSVKEPNMFHKQKITRKDSDATENMQLYRVFRLFRPRSSCTTHLMLFCERPPTYALCMTISGGRTEQLYGSICCAMAITCHKRHKLKVYNDV